VRFSLTPEQLALRQEIRDYFAGWVTPEFRDALFDELQQGEGGQLHEDSARKIGRDGWLGVGWPVEYGGKGWGAVEQYLFFEEVTFAGASIPMLALNTVGPAIMRFGSEEQKNRILPAILRGECSISIGYSEPGAGTDLASLRTRAELDGEEWVINGQKMFTTGAQYADYIWLAARTDPDAPKHKGITVFLVDTSLPGFSVVPIHTLMARTNMTYYDNVRVPKNAVVGDVNAGWQLITTQLNNERVSMVSVGFFERAYEDVRRWALETKLADGQRVIDREWVQTHLARVRAGIDVLRLMNWRVAWSVEHDCFQHSYASSVKVYASEFGIKAYDLLEEIIGEHAYLVEGTPGAVVDGCLERQHRFALLSTFGGSVNEIQREIIAMAGLGMPRAPR